jgi:hypothetical protein
VTLIYSTDRERRLRLVLRVVLVLGVMVGALAVFAAVAVGGDTRTSGLVFGAIAVALLASSSAGLRMLPRRDAGARWSAVATAVVTTVAALAFVPSYLGIVILLLAAVVLALALLPDDPELT